MKFRFSEFLGAKNIGVGFNETLAPKNMESWLLLDPKMLDEHTFFVPPLQIDSTATSRLKTLCDPC